MSNLLKHAMQEFEAAGWVTADGIWADKMQEQMCTHLLKLLTVFADEGHSGFSANYATNLFNELARYKPIVPLTGEDSEWKDISAMSGSERYQNKRCGRVFKDADGRAYDIEGTIFRNADGVCYASGASHVTITFPYTPTTKYVEVDA